MIYRSFPGLETPVSVIGFGTWALGGPAEFGGKQTGWGEADDAGSLRAIACALDCGINFFDTADTYGHGHSEWILGKALSASSHRAVVCTKYGWRKDHVGQPYRDYGSTWLRQAVQNSLQRLRRDYIDILLLHSPPDEFAWESFDRTALEQLKSEGLIRCYGVSSVTVKGAHRVLHHRFGRAVESIYNALDRRAASLLPDCAACGIGFIARVPLASGFLSGKYSDPSFEFPNNDHRSQLLPQAREWMAESVKKLPFFSPTSNDMAVGALRFAFTHEGVATAIPGLRTEAQVRQALEAVERGPLDASLLRQIETAVPEVFPGWL